MKKPEYVGYVACALLLSEIALPTAVWCTTASLASYACGWVAAAG